MTDDVRVRIVFEFKADRPYAKITAFWPWIEGIVRAAVEWTAWRIVHCSSVQVVNGEENKNTAFLMPEYEDHHG